MKIRHGGELQPGDFILIAHTGNIEFGWYFGTGRGTIQYINIGAPIGSYNTFKEWQAGKADWANKRFKKNGFTMKSIWKSYIYGEGIAPKASRVVKIDNPESVFTEQEDLDRYRQSKEALLITKFPAK